MRRLVGSFPIQRETDMRRLSRPKLSAALFMAASLLATAGAHAVEEDADRILQAMGEYLKSADEFSFRAEISYDVMLSTGEKVQYGSTSDVSVRRPELFRHTNTLPP